jgi:hypothetical protein
MKKKVKKVSKFVYWVPRIFSILFLIWLAIFSLDVFGNGYTFWQTVLAFLMHNIPVFVLLIILIIAWKHEIVGAIAFFVAGLLYVLQLIITTIRNPPFHWYHLSWSLFIAGPAIFIAILFYIGWKQKRRK